MNKTKLFIVSILLILIHSGYSQDILKNKTFAVIDTSKCKLEQAHQIYTWITKNIAYDVKAFLKGNSKIKSAQDIIKKKKGICADYSLLFNEMCNQAGIEVSTVSGYSKGADYYKGGGFYRADHCWNVIYVDTLWYLVDPTWGSGYVKRIPTQLDKIKYFLFKIPYVNKKLIFVKSPTDIYFNMLKAPFSRKHMPLDPKWQLEQYPFTIKSFENDTLKELGTYLNYKQEIINSKGLSVSQQLYTEGLNGKTFNKKNDFDIAYGLLSIASEFNDEATKVDSLTKPLFKTNLFYYQNATKYISHYKVVNDSVFSQRLNFLKKESYNGKKIVVNLKRKLKMEQGLYFKQQENLDKKNNSLTQKIDRLGKLIEVESQRNYYRFPTGKVIKSDTSIINLNLRSLKKSIIKSFSLKKEIDSLFIKNNENLQLDSVFSLECILTKQKFIELTFNFKSRLATEDNLIIFNFWKDIEFNYNILIAKYKSKGRNLSAMRSSYGKANINMNIMVTEFQKQLEIMTKLYRNSYDSISRANYSMDLHKAWQESNKALMNFARNYLIMNNQLASFKFKDYQLSELLRGEPIKNITLFVKYGEELFSNQKRIYSNEKRIVKDIENASSRGARRLNLKVLEYKLGLLKN